MNIDCFSDLSEALHTLSESATEGRGLFAPFEVHRLPGDALQLRFVHHPNQTLYLSVSGEQFLAIVYLCKEELIDAEELPQLWGDLLATNIAMFPSSFARWEGYLVIFRLIPTEVTLDNLLAELIQLIHDAQDALAMLDHYWVVGDSSQDISPVERGRTEA